MNLNPWKDVSTNVSNPDGQMDKDVVQNVEKSHFTWKNSRNLGLYTAFDRAGSVILSISTIVSIYMIISSDSIGDSFTAVLITIGLLVGLDSFGFISVILASPTRVLVVASTITIISAIWIPNKRIIAMAVIVSILSLLVSIAFNSRWMRSENYRVSDAVLHGFKCDPENESGREWKRWGKRECRTLYGELGFPIDDSTIDLYAKPIFYAIFFKLKSRWKNQSDELAESYKEINGLKTEKGVLEDKLRKVQERVDRHDSDTSSLYRTIENLKAEVEKMATINAQLIVTNDELLNALNDTEAKEIDIVAEQEETDQIDAESIIRMTPEEQCIYLLENTDHTYRTISEMVGFSKSKVSNICKEKGLRK